MHKQNECNILVIEYNAMHIYMKTLTVKAYVRNFIFSQPSNINLKSKIRNCRKKWTSLHIKESDAKKRWQFVLL